MFRSLNHGFRRQADRMRARARLRGRRLRRNMRGRLERRQQWLLRSHKRVPSLPFFSGCDPLGPANRRNHHVHMQ